MKEIDKEIFTVTQNYVLQYVLIYWALEIIISCLFQKPIFQILQKGSKIRDVNIFTPYFTFMIFLH